EWKDMKGVGQYGPNVLTKLRKLKFFLKSWKKDEYGNISSRLAGIRENILLLDRKEEEYGLSREEISDRRM
ncbi:hypothetical protein Ancab_019664, partial [Ancistrocladus abbreviatus]